MMTFLTVRKSMQKKQNGKILESESLGETVCKLWTGICQRKGKDIIVRTTSKKKFNEKLKRNYPIQKPFIESLNEQMRIQYVD